MKPHLGKAFDTWIYHAPGGDPLKIPVRVVKEKKAGRNGETEVTYFQVMLPAYVIDETDTDLEQLRKKVFAALAVPFEITWQPFYHIEVKGDWHPQAYRHMVAWKLENRSEMARNQRWHRAYDDDYDRGVSRVHLLNGDTAVELAITEYDFGTTKDGRQVHRRRSGKTVRQLRPGKSRSHRSSYVYEGVIGKGWPEAVVNDQRFDGRCVQANIPITPETTAALTAIVRNMALLKQQLDTLLHPDVAFKNLLSVAKHMPQALAAPAKPVKKRK